MEELAKNSIPRTLECKKALLDLERANSYISLLEEKLSQLEIKRNALEQDLRYVREQNDNFRAASYQILAVLSPSSGESPRDSQTIRPQRA